MEGELIMDGELIDGDLYIYRFGDLRVQVCPYYHCGKRCGIWCPLFIIDSSARLFILGCAGVRHEIEDIGDK